MDAEQDLEAIRQLKARYFRLMDTKDWEGMAELFTTDVEIDMRGEGATVSHGVDEFLPFLQDILGDVVTVHHGHMPEITITSSNTATGIWAMEDELWWPDGSPVRHMHGYGHYHETYEKTDEGWRIKTMRLTRLQRLVDRGR
jgi:uncharacterized protein (TIGR02246 family)